jgi:hypothetical protein
MLRTAFILSLCLFLTGCLPSKEKQLSADTAKIVKGEIDGQTYYVPEVYFVPMASRMSDPKSFSIYVQVLYPEFSPILELTQNLWTRGESYRYIHILAKHNQGKKFDHASEAAQTRLDASIRGRKTTQVVGEEYGLLHQTQTPDGIQDFDDVWIEKIDDRIISHITCGEKILKTDVPQCVHWTYWGNFFMEVYYDKRLLPEWKGVQEKARALFDSFKSEKTARAFLSERLESRQINQGIQPKGDDR